MSYLHAGDVSEHSYFSPSEKNPIRNRNGTPCVSKPSTSRSFVYNFTPSAEKRNGLANFSRNSVLDNRIAASASSDYPAELGSSIHFVPAKRPFETDSKELKTKYICITGKNSGPFASVSGQNGGIRAYPTTNRIQSKLLNGNSSTSAISDTGTSGTTVNTPPPPPPGVPPPLFDIFPADGIRLQWDPELRCSTSVGLNNLGNTCFLNSVLQVLTNTAPLTNYLLSKEHDSQACPLSAGSSCCAICLMKSHIRRVFSFAGNGNDLMSPTPIVSKIRSFMKSHTSGRQEDAHEFLRYFLDAMQSAALFPFKDRKLDLFTKETSVISRVFGGFHKSEIVCNSCHSSSVTYDPFLDLSVEIKQSNTLEAALSHFTSVEILSSDNAYQCPKCNRRVSAKKIFTIFQAPNVLTIQLKRFDHLGKIDRQITYPERLNLRPYMTEKQGAPILYKLYGIIVHVGRTTHSGHYYAFVKNPCDQWHVMDDSRVSSVPTQNALRVSAAYVLFYMRLPTPVASVKPQAKPQPVFIGPQRPAAQPVEETAKSDNHSGFKGTFSEIPSESATRPVTPIVGRLTPGANPALRVQPLKFRLTSNKNGLTSVQAGQGGSQPSQHPPPARQIILKIKPIQDSNVSSSTKLVPYEDDEEEEEEKVEEAPKKASNDTNDKSKSETATDPIDAISGNTSRSEKSPPEVSSTSLSEMVPSQADRSSKMED